MKPGCIYHSMHRGLALRNFPVLAQSTKAQNSPYGAKTQRLSKVLASLGVASRRKAEELIIEGKVKVNGEVVTIPQTPVHKTKDRVKQPISFFLFRGDTICQIVVDGQSIKGSKTKEKFYFVLNKPKGYHCTSEATTADGTRRRVVLNLFDEWLENWKKRNPQSLFPPRLFTIGRLDRTSRGLLLVTNDGAWAQEVAHPSSGLTKEYVVHVTPSVSMREVHSIQEGCEVDGKYIEPEGVAIENGFLRIVVSEGRNHEVRRLVEKTGLLVKSLKRVRIGGYRLPNDLKEGEFRALKTNERRRVTNLGAQNLV